MRHRVMVEVEYLLALIEHKSFQKTRSLSKKTLNSLKGLYVEFSATHFKQIKKIEKKTNHDVNAVVVFVSEKLKKIGRDDLVPFVHFGLTSEDINNISYSLMTQGAVKDVMIPSAKGVLKELKALSKKTKSLSLLSLTHGQPATTTTLGKELAVFVSRVEREIALVKKIKLLAKLSGATGSYAAHKVAFPDFNWPLFSKRFIKKLGLEQSPISTQIEPGDSLAELLHSFVRINNIFSDFSLDMWLYISRNIFVQKNIVGEVGSSTMPHKINPIFFENAEGNLDIANNNFSFLASRITKSRLQRDLSDSTVLRNIGMSFGYTKIGITSLQNGLQKIAPNKEFILNELDNNWEVLTEAVQTIMRYEGIDNAYEQLKNLSRGKKLDKSSYKNFVNSLDISDKSKEKLLSLTPAKYIGLAKKV